MTVWAEVLISCCLWCFHWILFVTSSIQKWNASHKNATSQFSTTQPHIVQPLLWILSMMVILSSRVILVICIFTWFSLLYWKSSHSIFLLSGRDSVLAVGYANDRSSPLANYSVSAVLAADRTPIDQIPQTQINQAIFWPEKRWIWAKADT